MSDVRDSDVRCRADLTRLERDSDKIRSKIDRLPDNARHALLSSWQ